MLRSSIPSIGLEGCSRGGRLARGDFSTLTARIALTRVLPSLLAFAALVIRVISGPYITDDAYITFRYARNLSSGLGLVYTPGEPVLGTTTPLYALILSLPAVGFGPEGIPTYAVWINAAADAASVFLVYFLAREMQISASAAALAGLLLAVSPLSLRYSLGGMEASLTTALLLGASASHIRGQRLTRDSLATLVVFSRPDAVLAIVLFGLSDLHTARRLRWSTALLPVTAVVIATAVSQLIYGAPVPHSVVAKSAPIYRAPPETNLLQFAHNLGGLFFGPALGIVAKGNFLIIRGELGWLASGLFVLNFILWLRGASATVRAKPAWLPIFAFPVGYATIYSVLGLTGALVADWYMAVLVPFYLFGIVSFLRGWSDSFVGALRQTAFFGVAALLVVAELAGLNLGRTQQRGFWVPDQVWLERELIYREIAEEYLEELSQAQIVAASEVGSLGYYCRCRILDTVGLVSPQAVKFYPVEERKVIATYAVPVELIQAVEPDYLVTLEVFIRETLLQDEWFKQHYELTDRRETEAFGSRGLLVFVRRSVSPPE